MTLTKRQIASRLRELADQIDPDLRNTTEEVAWTGPVQTREEVVGTSTKGKNKNFSNSGFGGGQPEQLEAA